MVSLCSGFFKEWFLALLVHHLMNFGNCMIFFQTFVADCTEKVDLNMIELVCDYISSYLPR